MKQIKDPLYGYIDLEDKFIPLIDTPEFQRLRNIRQTGYQPLYPSALHNRFVHSIGVLHLGQKAFACFEKNVRNGGVIDYPNERWEQLKFSFMLACLLHDVGHSPFSHTGEDYYYISANFKQEFIDSLPEAVDFHSDIRAGGTGKPHEAMSALVGLDMLRRLKLANIDEEFFARAIIGIGYKKSPEERLIENTLIGMLNGSLVDVDKLDYLLRDAYVTGFNTMALDVDRLFAGHTIERGIFNGRPKILSVYKRGSLSVIENVTFANDLERHWIQNHPVILYDVKLLQKAIELYDHTMCDRYSEQLGEEKSIFTRTAISPGGYMNRGIPLRLLCDDDIIIFLKNQASEDIISKQFFDRNTRLKPLWKSEIEFRHLESELFGHGIIDSFKRMLQALPENIFFIDETVLNAAEAEREIVEKSITSTDPQVKATAETALIAQNNILKVLNIFKQFSTAEGLDFQFAYVYLENSFESNYVKLEGADIHIYFAPGRIIPLRKALSVKGVKTNADENGGYFFLYTSEKNIRLLSQAGKDPATTVMAFIAKHWEIA